MVAKTKAGTRDADKPSAPARAVSKDELRSQVQKLERANAALRAKNRQVNRAAKLSVRPRGRGGPAPAAPLARRRTPAQLQPCGGGAGLSGRSTEVGSALPMPQQRQRASSTSRSCRRQPT
jgi:hypothetical protein